MKQHILPALKLTVFAFVLFVVLYTALVWVIAQAAPNKGRGETVTSKGKIVGFEKEGQRFDRDDYFRGRPSAVGYNGAGSGGSNKGPSNPGYLEKVKAEADTFLAHNPGVSREQVPSEMVTASGSGLDPHISTEAAYLQVKRIAVRRGLPEADISRLIEQHTEPPLFGIFGPTKINVLKLNVSLDELKR